MNKLFIFFLILLTSCGSNKDSREPSVERIEFGKGGGITGEVTTYSLNSEGELYLNEETKIKTLNKKETLKLFQEASNFQDYQYHQPQNMYNFIRLTSKNKSNRIVWGAEAENLNKNIPILFKQLKQATIIAK